MASSSPAKFLFGFLLTSIVLWMLFIFASRMVAWILSRVLGASVGFRVGGWKCLRDVVIKFKKGPVESLSIGEIKVSLRQSLIKLGTGLFSKDPKLQIVICDIEIVVRPPNKSKQKPRSRKSLNSTSGRGKWMVVANVARFLSVAISDLVLKTPKAVVEVKDLKVDISKDGGSMPNLFVKLHVSPIIIHLCEPRFSYDQSSVIDYEKCTLSSQMPMAAVERSSAPFSCEELLISCEFGHDREAGVAVKNLDIHCGEVHVNLDEAMVSKRKSSSDTFSHTDEECTDHLAANDMTPKNKSGLVLLPKYVTMIPEKVSFSLPKLNINFLHREHDLLIENRIMGIQLRSLKSRSNEDVGESTRLDVQLDFSEIHLLRESSSSLMEIMKVDVVSLVYIPSEPTSPVRAEVDVKLGGTQCNLLMGRLEPWLRMIFSREKKKMVLQERSTKSKRLPSSDGKSIMWTCTLSAPEMTLILYSMSGSPLYHGCSQSSHVFANNVSDMGTTVHMELGELNLHTEDEYQECLKENLFGVESNYGSIIHIAKVSLDWGKKEMEATEQNISSKKLALSVDISGMGVSLTFKRIESLIWTVLSFQALWKSLSASRKRSVQIQGTRSSSSSGKGTRLIQFNLERCSVTFSGEAGLENASIADPKRVNYGSQGGRVVIDVSADGNPRTATIMSTVEDSYKKLNYSVSLDIFHLSVCMNKDTHSNQIELERARSIYQEFFEDRNPDAKVVLFDILNAKFVRRPGNHKEISVCSLFGATDVTVRWEPDVHLSLFELLLRIKSVVHHHKLEQKSIKTTDDVCTVQNMESNNDPAKELDKHPKQKKKELIFAVDVEMLTVSAAVGDGVDVLVQVHSIFSENARIGVLFEGLVLSFNGARLLKSSRMQVSRVPSSTQNSKAFAVTKWDWVIQGLDFHICLPYRLELRAIDDSIEDMLRALKLITAVKTMLLYPWKKESSKPKKHKSSALGCIRLGIRKLTAEIEEEPIQGWLDEHYHLMRNEFYEQAVRMKYADEIKKGNSSPQNVEATDGSQEKKLSHDSVEFEGDDSKSLSKLREEIYEQSFLSYFRACQNLKPSGGSGACREGFQSGFKPSASRSFLLSISATEFDLTLSGIDGGDDGMIEILKQLDPVYRECDIPFSRLYGQNILLNTGTLVVQLRNYTHPMLWATSGKCKGRVILAQQATYFQPQIYQEVFVGKWRKVRMLRSASGTTPPMKTYSDLPICFQKGEISFGVGYEPAFADVSYAFTVALRRANLSIRNPGPLIQPPKKEKSLPWWDDMRNYIHGKISLSFGESRWHILATADPYEKLDKLQIVSSLMELQQSDGRFFISAKDFKIFVSSLQGLGKNRCLKIPVGVCDPFLDTPAFTLEILMDWECDSGQPLNHFLHALPNDGKTRDKVLDPFRSTSLSLRWNFSLRPSLPLSEKSQSSSPRHDVSVAANELWGSQGVETEARNPTFNIGAHDLAWVLKFWSMNYLPPHKLRSFSRWPRFGVARAVRSGNLSLDRVMTEFMLRFAATPACIRHVPLADDDPAKGLTFSMSKLKYELCFSRGKQKYTFDSKREPLDLVYQGLDLHIPKAFLYRNIEDPPCSAKAGQVVVKTVQSALADRVPAEKVSTVSNYTDKQRDDGFLLSSDYFTIRRQSPKADPARLLAWQEAGRKNLEMTYVRSEFENGSESDEHARSDQSDDDGYNVVIADNCQRVFVYGLKLLWTIENRDAVWSWVGGLSKAFESPKPSPSCVYAQRKLHQENKEDIGLLIKKEEDAGPELTENELIKSSASHGVTSPPAGQVDTATALTSHPHSSRSENSVSTAIVKNGTLDDSEKEGKRHLMVNVIEPQFNLHSEEANGRFLLAAVSGRVLAQSFHSLLHIDHEMIEQALGSTKLLDSEAKPEMQWKRMEFSVMLERVQAHVAPTDVDPGAGLQWLPKVLKSSAKVKRTGALLERVFMPCDMYFRYTRHKGGTPDLKVKPLKELAFNSKDITATMTSRQFQVMLDVLTNLLFARLPKPRKSSLTYPIDDDEDIEEEADEMVPDGVEEVEVAKINLEKREWEQKLLIDDIRRLSHGGESADSNVEKDDLWMINGGKHALVQGLKRELVNAQKSRKTASAALRKALQKAAQLRLMEKEKNKSPSYAMRISLQINKVVWGMLMDGKAFAEAEINDMIYDFDRDYKDIGVACFMTKSVVVRNCLPNAKSDTLLSAWNPPSEWGKNVMLRVDAKQGASREGNSLLELFQVEIYPLKIHLTETMYRMMWEYLFPEEEQDTQRRQEVWKVTTTAGAKRVKKGLSAHEASTSNSPSTKETDVSSRSNVSAATIALANNQIVADPLQASRQQNFKENLVRGSTPELRRTSSFDRSWEEDVAESVANDLLLQVQSSAISSSSKSALLGSAEQHDESSKNKSKDSKNVKSGRTSHEDKKLVKPLDEKRTRPRKLMEFHNIKISQVELLLTYEGSRFVVNDLKLLMDTFHRDEFVGTWRRLFSRVKKHIIWGVLKSVTGMQGKKFKEKLGQKDANGASVPDSDLNFSDNEGGQAENQELYPISWPRRPTDGAGDGFVTSVKGLFNTQRRKAKKFVLRTMRGEADNDRQWSESDGEFHPYARQLTITKATTRLIRRHTKKFRTRQKGSSPQQHDLLPSSPRENMPLESEYSSGSSSYEDFNV